MRDAASKVPRVSVIVPNYNHARFLEQRLSSITRQTFQDTELILLDDASTDNSRDILSSYEKIPNTRLILNEHNSGSVFKQWNRGVREAKGEYIWIAESDDYADPSLLSRLVSCLDAHPQVGLAYCQSKIVDDNNTDLGVNIGFYKYLDDQRWRSDFVGNGREECAHYHVFRNTIPNASAVLFRRSVYLKAGWADERMRLAGDWLQWSRMLMLSDVAYVSEPLNHYRVHLGTVRAATLESPHALREFLAVTAFIRRHVKIAETVRQTVNEQWAEMWGRCDGLGAAGRIQLLMRAFWTDPKLVAERVKSILRSKCSHSQG